MSNNFSLSDNSLINRFMRGIILSNPPKTKCTCTWDVSKVLEYLKFLHPLQSLSIEELTLKTSALIALTTAQRYTL